VLHLLAPRWLMWQLQAQEETNDSSVSGAWRL
jgi:hypothetical protein